MLTYRVTIGIASQNNSRSAVTRVQLASVLYLRVVPQVIGVIFYILTSSLVELHIVLARCKRTIVRGLMTVLISFYTTDSVTVFILDRWSLRFLESAILPLLIVIFCTQKIIFNELY